PDDLRSGPDVDAVAEPRRAGAPLAGAESDRDHRRDVAARADGRVTPDADAVPVSDVEPRPDVGGGIDGDSGRELAEEGDRLVDDFSQEARDPRPAVVDVVTESVNEDRVKARGT